MSAARSGAAGGGLLRSASVLGGWTMVSRVLGYARDSINAALFGAGWVADAYFVAFRIPNLLRDLVAEGAASAAVIPALARVRQRAGERAAANLGGALLSAAAAGGVGLIVLGALAAPWIVSAMAPGFAPGSEVRGLTVGLTRRLFPFIACMSLAAVTMAWLNARGRFAPGAAAPAAMNAVVIAGGLALLLRGDAAPEVLIYGWALAVVIGGAAQWLVQMPAARATGLRWGWPIRHPALRDVGALMLPALAGSAVTQLHLLVNTILASLLPAGSVAHLYYGNRLMQLPLGVVGVALSTAAYPAVAAALAAGRPARAADPVNRALRFAAFAVLPATAGLIALGGPITALLFRSGRFSESDAVITAAVSSAYAIGILGHSAIRILTPPFYAAGRPGTPVRIAMAGVAANAALSALLMPALGVIALPLATSAVTLATAGWLGVRLRDAIPGVGAGLLPSVARSLALATAMGLVVWAAAGQAATLPALAGLPPKARDAAVTGGGIVLGLGVFLLLARAFRAPEWTELRRAFGGRRGA